MCEISTPDINNGSWSSASDSEKAAIEIAVYNLAERNKWTLFSQIGEIAYN